MNVWDSYLGRTAVHGKTRREAALKRERSYVGRKAADSLSYFDVPIDGVTHAVTIINTDNLDTKKIFSMPGEDIPHGGLVEWMGQHWLITERDANTEVYARGVMQQCNYLLRWIDTATKEIMERWCVIEDGTKYLTGEFGARDMAMNRGDSRISLTISKDERTLRFDRNSRFIVDDYGSPEPLAYRMTKPYKLGGSYDDTGVLRFVLTECNTEDDDNLELHIADYYSYFTRDGNISDESEDTSETEERRVWI